MQAHVAVGVSLLIALSLGSAVAVTSRVVTRRALEGAAWDLSAARRAFDRLVDAQAREASVQARFIAQLPVFRAHLIDPQLASDAATMDAMATDYRTQLDAAFLIVGSRRSVVTGRAGWPTRSLSSLVQSALAGAVAGTASRRLTAVDGDLYLIVAEPARFADEVLGAIVVGYTLDDRVARELAAITRCEVNLITGQAVAATSLAPTARRQLDALVRDAAFTATSAPAVRDVGTGTYVAATYPLSIAGDTVEGRLVLLQDWQPTRQSLREVRLQMALGGIAIFGLSLAAALVFSGRVTEALADISRAASETAAGDWTKLVPERGSAEVRSLACAVNAMATNLNRHHSEVEAQRLRVFRATMTTVHDLVNNFLANMQLIRLEAEDRLPQETLDLFDQLIQDNAAELRLLGELQVVREKEMAVGTGIEYPTVSGLKSQVRWAAEA
ncbi:HAMP domain protein [Luteitalea pratensis]|uniref:HAMP domain protein n=2 Tax=Luteitalea pratensis TaxID=1855912 RepID=A0A143PVC5_LUTPR|nr:HAMP domain protein [Luteitalea pratensis]